MPSFFLALQMLWRDLRSRELTLLGLALFIAVLSLSSVEFVVGRIERTLLRDATQMMGADLVISADHPVPDSFIVQAQKAGLRLTRNVTFSSMASTGTGAQLSAIKALEPGNPLRGSLQIVDQPGQPAREAGRIPQAGEAWVDEQLLNALQLKPGDHFQLGYLHLRVGAVVSWESDRGIGFSSFSPRVLINAVDLPASGLLVEGSRARYRLLVAGPQTRVRAYEAWAKPLMGRGEALESLDSARPELRSSLDRGTRFLRLVAMLAVVLSAVAIGLSSRQYLSRHLNGAAVMRCVGATRRQLMQIYGFEFTVFALLVSALACLAGYCLQAGIALLAARVLHAEMPPADAIPVLHGMLVGLVLMLGFVMPQLMRLTQVPPLRALRREWEGAGLQGGALWALGGLTLAALLLWVAGDWKLGCVVVGGLALAVILFGGLAGLLVHLSTRLRFDSAGWGVRYGIAVLHRRRASSVVQIVALSIGLSCLLLLELVSADLLSGWSKQQAPDAPNRFVIGIQPDQSAALLAQLAQHGFSVTLQPMVRGRLVAVNGHKVSAQTYTEERARNLVEREFNLSQADRLPAGNAVVDGHWHGVTHAPVFSMEQGVGKTLGIRLGDQIEFQIAGEHVTGRVGSIRRLEWSSMQVNFFFISNPGLLDAQPASYITSFHLASGQTTLVRELVSAFPNISVIDVDALLEQISLFAEKLSAMVQLVLGFAVAAGIIVLLAAQRSTHAERAYEFSVLRALGARNRQIHTALLVEFVTQAILTTVLANTIAIAIAWGLAHFVFDMDFMPDLARLLMLGVLAAATIVGAGWLGVRKVIAQPAIEGIRAV